MSDHPGADGPAPPPPTGTPPTPEPSVSESSASESAVAGAAVASGVGGAGAVPAQAPLFPPTAAEGMAAERAELLALLDGHAAVLDAVDAAIERIEAGAYGRCGRCGQHLPEDQLADDPFAVAHAEACAPATAVGAADAGPLTS